MLVTTSCRRRSGVEAPRLNLCLARNSQYKIYDGYIPARLHVVCWDRRALNRMNVNRSLIPLQLSDEVSSHFLLHCLKEKGKQLIRKQLSCRKFGRNVVDHCVWWQTRTSVVATRLEVRSSKRAATSSATRKQGLFEGIGAHLVNSKRENR